MPEGEHYLPMVSRPAVAVRWVCFPHAGGTSTTFRDWGPHLPSTMDLIAARYPGHEYGCIDALPVDLHDLADLLATGLRTWNDVPLVLFGHSMGALVAYEVARRLERSWRGGPAHVVVSGQPPPAEHRTGSARAGQEEERMIAELRRLGGISDQVLASTDLRKLFLRVIRSDLRMVEQYRPDPAGSLGCSLTGVRGSTDQEVTTAELARWEAHTRLRFRSHVLDGDHFAPVRRTGELLPQLAREITAYSGVPAEPPLP